MVNRDISFGIVCDVCYEPLIYHDQHVLISYRGHVLKEDTPEHIIEVAEFYEWMIIDDKHICPECIKTIIK